MATDSNIVRSPSVIAGTLPTGLSLRYSGDLRYSALAARSPTSAMSYGMPSSSQAQMGRAPRVPGGPWWMMMGIWCFFGRQKGEKWSG